MLLLSLALAAASAAELQPAWGPLRWGMTKDEAETALHGSNRAHVPRRPWSRTEFDFQGFHCFAGFSTCDRLNGLDCSGGYHKTQAEAEAKAAALEEALARSYPSTRGGLQVFHSRNDTSLGSGYWAVSAELAPAQAKLALRDIDRLPPFLAQWPPDWATRESVDPKTCQREFLGVARSAAAGPIESADAAAPQIKVYYYKRDGYDWRQQMGYARQGFWSQSRFAFNGLPGLGGETLYPPGRIVRLFARTGLFMIATKTGPDKAATAALVEGFLQSFRPAFAADQSPVDLEYEVLGASEPRKRFLEITAPAAGSAFLTSHWSDRGQGIKTLVWAPHVMVTYRHKGLRTIAFSFASKTKPRTSGAPAYGGGGWPIERGVMMELSDDLPESEDYWLELTGIAEDGSTVTASTGPFTVRH